MSDLRVSPQDLGLDRLFDEVGEAIFVTEAATGRIVLWNRGATRIFGYSSSEVLGTGIEELIPGALRERHSEGMTLYEEAGNEAYIDSKGLLESPAVRKGAEEISIEMSLSSVTPVRNAGGAETRYLLFIVREVTEQKRTLDRLAESDRRFASVLSNAHAYVYRCRNEPGYANEFASDYALDLTGYPPEDLHIGGKVSFGDLIVEDDRERVWEEVQGALARRERFELRYTIRRRDGELRSVEEYGQGVYDENGDVVVLEGLVYDVTKRDQMVERLREAEERYRTLVERIPAIIYIEEMNGRMTTLYDSPQIETMLGYPQGTYLEDPDYWVKIIHSDDRERVRTNLRRAGTRCESFSQEYRVAAADGRVIWVRDNAVIVRDEADEPLYWQGFIFDITDRKEVEERLRASEAELRALFEAMTDVILVLDREGRYLEVAPTNPSLLYRPSSEMLGKTLHDVFPKERADAFLSLIRQALETRQTITSDYDLQIGDQQVWFEATFSPMLEDSVVVVARDVTQRRKSEEALRRSEAGLSEAQRMAHLGSWEWDVKTGEVWWSDEVFRIYGFQPGEFTPDFDRLLEVVHPEDRELLRQNVEGALHNGEPYDFEHRVMRPDGEVRVLHRRAEVVRDERGEALRMIGTVYDITERKIFEKQLEYQALHDSLTRLPNRALFMDRLEQAVVRAKRRNTRLVVLFMDLDNFKVINDSLGHEAGDQLLIAVAERLRTCLRPEDTAARLGGDEFTILLEDLSGLGGAIRVVERIMEALRTAFIVGRREVYISASFGVALWDAAGQSSPAALLRNADQAMYRAKYAGKARYDVFEEAMNARALERLELENDLRRALERREFTVHYQPIVTLDEDQVVGFEALVRWNRPEHGLLAAGEFVPLAEDTGLIVPLGRWVIQESCRQAREWRERYPGIQPPTVLVNLSAKQLRVTDLAQTLGRITRQTGIDPRSLEVEITEGAAMGDAPATAAVLEELKTLGVRVAIDDFGTGYSSLSYLERFPVDSLKIDRYFVENLGQDPGTTVLVKGMIDLAHALGLKVIAEGVETEVQLQGIREMGCDLAQGYLFSRPLPGEAAGELLDP